MAGGGYPPAGGGYPVPAGGYPVGGAPGGAPGGKPVASGYPIAKMGNQPLSAICQIT